MKNVDLQSWDELGFNTLEILNSKEWKLIFQKRYLIWGKDWMRGP